MGVLRSHSVLEESLFLDNIEFTSTSQLVEDTDDDNDGWSDVDENSCGTDPLDSNDTPTDSNWQRRMRCDRGGRL